MIWKKDFHKFSNGIMVEAKIENLYYSTDVKNLSIIKSGAVPPNPSELLASKTMNDFIKQIKNTFDVVLFDTEFQQQVKVTDASFILINL